jgi:hypothetical protein
MFGKADKQKFSAYMTRTNRVHAHDRTVAQQR